MLITLLIITVMFAFKIQLTRSVILIFAVLSIALVWAKEDGSLRWQRRRLTSADSQTRIIPARLAGANAEHARPHRRQQRHELPRRAAV